MFDLLIYVIIAWFIIIIISGIYVTFTTFPEISDGIKKAIKIVKGMLTVNKLI